MQVSMFDVLPCPCGQPPAKLGDALVAWCFCPVVAFEGDSPEESVMLWNDWTATPQGEQK
jgi:hypothetical protein